MEQPYRPAACRVFVCLTVSLAICTPGVLAAGAPSDWQTVLRNRLPLYGHRNWIVIADSAYPDQSAEGIETIVSNDDQISVLKEVLAELQRSKHVRPIVYTDQELKFINDNDAPGVSTYRNQLNELLGNQSVTARPHEELIAKLGSVSKTFHVLIIKTNLTVPYTTVFLQLDCAYWGLDAEKKLRARMSGQQRK